jgi:hypothetical protein
MMNSKILRPRFGIAALIAFIVFTAIAPIGAVVPHAGLGQADAKKVTVTLMRWPYT